MADVEYAHAEDGTNIAYQVLAASIDSGVPRTHDIVMVSGGMFPMEVFDQERGFARLLDGLKSMGRVVVFDRRGIGLSDPIFAWDGFGIATRFAAEHTPRVRSLVLFHPLMTTDEEWETWRADRFGQVSENLAGGHHQFLELIALSSAGDPSFRDWYTRAGRIGASPATAARIWESVFRSHPRDQRLSEVTTTTLVMHRVGNRYIPPEWVLAAVMFTDLVGSTERAASLGDDRWKAVLDRHDAILRNGVGRVRRPCREERGGRRSRRVPVGRCRGARRESGPSRPGRRWAQRSHRTSRG